MTRMIWSEVELYRKCMPSSTEVSNSLFTPAVPVLYNHITVSGIFLKRMAESIERSCPLDIFKHAHHTISEATLVVILGEVCFTGSFLDESDSSCYSAAS